MSHHQDRRTAYEQFIARRNSYDCDYVALATETLSSPFFCKSLDSASTFLVWRHNRWAKEQIEGIARQTLHTYLVNSSGATFKDGGEASFETWLYGMCLRHVRWALGRWLRTQRPTSGNQRAVQLDEKDVPARTDIPEGVWVRAQSIIVRTIGSWPEKHLRTAMLDLLDDLDVEITARKLGRCRKTIQNYHREGFRRLRKNLAEELGLG